MSQIDTQKNDEKSNAFAEALRTVKEAVLFGGWPIVLLLAVFLIAVSFFNYLLFHTLIEFFTIIIVVLMFVVAWHTHAFSKNGFLVFLTSGFFWVAMLDLVHALVYKGMHIYLITEANPATQFWIAARYIQALIFLFAPFFLTRSIHKTGAFVAFGVIAIICYVAIMGGNFPVAYIEGQGLTPFKINSEYVIIVLLGGAIIHMWRCRHLINIEILGPVSLALVLTMGAELAFTYYVGVYDISNLVGHILKFFSFWLIFIAIVRVNLIRPYNRLYEEIERRRSVEMELKTGNEELEQRVKERTLRLRKSEKRLSNAQHLAHIGNWNHDLETDDLMWSDEVYKIFDMTKTDFAGCFDAFLDRVHADDKANVERKYKEAVKKNGLFDIEHRIVRKSDGVILWVHDKCEFILNTSGEVRRADGTIQDITERKIVEEALKRAHAELELRVEERTKDLKHEILERKQTEEALRESERGLEEAQRIAGVGSWQMNFETGEAKWSDERFRIFGYEPGEVEPTFESFQDAVHPDDRERVLSEIYEARQLAAAFILECRIFQKNGEERIVQIQGEAILNPEGLTEGMSGEAAHEKRPI